MTDENNDMDVENILSSIKDILEEDAQNKDNKPDEVDNKGEDILSEVLSDDDGDIIELSEDMQIKTPKVLAENSDESLLAEDNGSEMVYPFEESNTPMGEALQKIDAAAEVETSNVDEKAEQPEERLFIEPDDIMGERTGAANEVSSDAWFLDGDVPEDSHSISIIENNGDADFGEEIKPAETASVIETFKNINEVAPSEDNQPKENMSEEQVVEAVDASANIISNFAKIFAKGREEHQSNNVKITALGDGSQTLEDFVKRAIVQVIGDDIARKWNNGSDYQVWAENEIKNQVSAWMNDNLPAVVEKIVKDEIERVMVKVG